MSDDKATCGFFVYHGGEIDSLGARWALWLERFKIYIDSSGISDAAKIKSKLLLMMGEEAYQTYKVLKKPDDTESAEQIYKLMTDHFNPKRSVFTERVRFRQTNKLPNEQVNAFALRLRERATYCKFEATLDENILEQFVVGCGMFEFQRECCRKDDLTLERALDIARGYERTECNVQGMLQQQPKESKLIYYNYNNNSKFESSKKASEKCYHCGGLKHAESSKCPARGKTCNKCGKKNHFSVVCKSAGQTKGLAKRETKSVSHLAQQPPPSY